MRFSFKATCALTTVAVACLSTTTASAQSTSDVTPASENTSKTAVCDGYRLVTVFFRCIPHDVSGIVQGDALRSLAVGGLLAGGSILLDDEVRKKMSEPDQDTSIEVGRYLGEAGVQFGAPAAAYFISRAIGNEGAQDLSIMIVRTQMVNAIFTRGLKLIPRARPYQDTATPTKGSFPSGHTSAAFATATVMQRKWGWKAGVPAYLVATFVGVTRLENVHYLSDVTFGAAVGVASGLAIKLPGAHPTVAPLVAPGVVGISITIGAPRS
jgi:membrane-associated phospholipid phosphatase